MSFLVYLKGKFSLICTFFLFSKFVIKQTISYHFLIFLSVTPATIPSTTPLQAPLPPPPHYGGKNLNLIRTEEEAMFSPESQDILPPNTQKKQRDQQPQQHQASYTQQQQQQQHSVHLEQQQQRQLPPSNFEEFRNNSVEWLRALLGRHEGGSGAGIGTIGGGAE
ncbi:hypothetical protein PPYR_02392 [Photinus pyralis]|uniref:Uncharacterized protein n=2 Tax=Photinus pyralis TaxID=7054 RepID=A0A5N4B744_PHOPY|nr:hypothetical protein PPYR_02392 [Photinus pyralis]